MRAKVGNTGEEVEIAQYREVNKGSLKAFFTLIEYDNGKYTKGRKTFDCRYFVGNDSAWINFPQKEVKSESGTTEYMPLVSFMDKEYADLLKNAAISLLKDAKPQEKHASSTNTWKKSPVQNQSSADYGDAPF